MNFPMHLCEYIDLYRVCVFSTVFPPANHFFVSSTKWFLSFAITSQETTTLCHSREREPVITSSHVVCQTSKPWHSVSGWNPLIKGIMEYHWAMPCRQDTTSCSCIATETSSLRLEIVGGILFNPLYQTDKQVAYYIYSKPCKLLNRYKCNVLQCREQTTNCSFITKEGVFVLLSWQLLENPLVLLWSWAHNEPIDTVKLLF